MWCVNRGLLMSGDQEHEPWRLRRATTNLLEQDLLEQAGLGDPAAAPSAHFADAMEVKVARPRLAVRQHRLP